MRALETQGYYFSIFRFLFCCQNVSLVVKQWDRQKHHHSWATLAPGTKPSAPVLSNLSSVGR